MIIDSAAYLWFLFLFGIAVLVAETSGRHLSKGFRAPWGRRAFGVMGLIFAVMCLGRGLGPTGIGMQARWLPLGTGAVWLLVAAAILLPGRHTEEEQGGSCITSSRAVFFVGFLSATALALFLGAGLTRQAGNTGAAWVMLLVAVGLVVTAGLYRLRELRSCGSGRRGPKERSTRT